MARLLDCILAAIDIIKGKLTCRCSSCITALHNLVATLVNEINRCQLRHLQMFGDTRLSTELQFENALSEYNGNIYRLLSEKLKTRICGVSTLELISGPSPDTGKLNGIIAPLTAFPSLANRSLTSVSNYIKHLASAKAVTLKKLHRRSQDADKAIDILVSYMVIRMNARLRELEEQHGGKRKPKNENPAKSTMPNSADA